MRCIVVIAFAATLAACGTDAPTTALPSGVDGWVTATPASQGMDAGVLQQADEFAAGLPTIRSLLVVRHGLMVFERYYRGFGPDDRPALRSVTKSVASTVYGVALARGDLPGLDQRLDSVFPQHFRTEDSAKRGITVRHLLTMTSGLNSSGADPAIKDTSWVRAYIQAPLISEPGATFRYDGALPHLLSGMFTEQAHVTLADYAREHVFTPLGITAVSWETDPEGYTSGFSGLSIRARDLAKIGQLYLQNGEWGGQQVIPRTWVAQAAVNQAPLGDSTAGYGYLWWISSETGHRAFFAAGYGGQYIYVIPGLDLVVVTTGDPDVTPDAPIYHRSIVSLYIVPAVRVR
jgi:CubicO group peptidase (beta-lactamase class C family)